MAPSRASDGSSLDNQRNALPFLRRLLAGFTTGMLTTFSDGRHEGHSRPMLLQEVGADGHIWLMTDRGSGKTVEIALQPQVNLSFVSRRQDRFVSVAGTATVRRDTARVQHLWHPSYRAWYPAGPTDPNLVLLDIEPSEVHYWLVPASRVVRAFEALKALILRRRYESGQHGRLALKG